MIITIGGRAGSGKSTVAKLVAKKLKLKHYSMGDLLRSIAKEKGISVLELSKQMESDPKIDNLIDEKQKKLAAAEDNFVIDGRLSAFFVPNAGIKVFLDADENTRAERILKDKRELEKNSDIKETIANIKRREASEAKRYKAFYGFDCYDKKQYDIIIDTTKPGAERVAELIISRIQKFK